HTKESLQTTIEELETANEELNATNEELIASNEELQSTNEELHSVNEELHTVNAEYQQKITELTQLTDDMNNLLASTAIGTVFLDEDLHIRRFTPESEKLLKLREGDVGRPLDEISPSFSYPTLYDDARQVLNTGQVHEQECRATSGRHYLVRLNPYLLNNGNIDGLVITFVDITLVKKMEEKADAERQLTRSILDCLPAMVIFKDDKNFILRINETGANWIGQPRHEIEGRESADVFGDDAAQKYYTDDLEVLESGEPKLGIVEEIHTDKGSRWVLTDKVPMETIDGGPGLVAVITDISELRRAQQNLEAATERFEAFMTNSPALKWAVDEDGRFVFINEAYAKYMRVSPHQCIGNRPPDVLATKTTEAFLERSKQTNERARLSEGPITFDIDVPIGENRYSFFVTKFTFNDSQGRRLIGGSAVDVTELKRVEQELKQVNEDLERRVNSRTAELTEARDQLEIRVEARTLDLRQRNEQLDQFARVASHDLRSPLRTIIGFTEILEQRMTSDDPLVNDAMGSIISAGQRMGHLIDALSSFSRIGRTPLRFGQVDLNKVVEQCRADLRAELEEAKVSLDVKPLPLVTGDPTLLRQVIQNLLTNAIKFVDDRSPEVEIGPVEADEEFGGGLFVRDNGIGIETGDLERIFQPFTRLHASHDYPGSGVGLAICRRIVDSHGGRIFATPNTNQPGVTFTIQFPVEVIHADDRGDSYEDTSHDSSG
ncbi:MAG: PAS domain-containing protein, partial [Planctomycetota bacterium]